MVSSDDLRTLDYLHLVQKQKLKTETLRNQITFLILRYCRIFVSVSWHGFSTPLRTFSSTRSWLRNSYSCSYAPSSPPPSSLPPSRTTISVSILITSTTRPWILPFYFGWTFPGGVGTFTRIVTLGRFQKFFSWQSKIFLLTTQNENSLTRPTPF